MSCLSCGASTTQVLDFGRQPISNGFLSEAQFAEEFFYELKVVVCDFCELAQLGEVVDPKLLFGPKYPFKTASSTRMVKHFAGLADFALKLGKPNVVVEIGANDGTLLRYLKERGVEGFGVDPSGGGHCIQKFFTIETAEELATIYGKVDLIIATNTLSHTANINEVLAGVKFLLSPEGYFVVEEPNLRLILRTVAFDQFYDEHVFYFSVKTLQAVLARHDLEIVSAVQQDVHGGSMRYIIRHGQPKLYIPKSSIRELFAAFRKKVDKNCRELRRVLKRFYDSHERVVGYGATSKSTTLFNYAKIGPELVEFILDTTPAKQGLFSPGVHIPVKSPEAFYADPPGYALLLAWNHAEEILEKERAFRDNGGGFLTYTPKVEVV